MRIYLIFALLLASACSPPSTVTRQHDDWTGFTQVITDEHEILRDTTAVMTARGIMIARDGKQGFAVLTNLRRLVPNGPIIQSMHNGDTRLHYHRHDRPLTHCNDRCRRAETGAIYMTKAGFEVASHTGLTLRIQGRRGRYTATVPAGLFAAVLKGGQ
mgnify:FL=1